MGKRCSWKSVTNDMVMFFAKHVMFVDTMLLFKTGRHFMTLCT